ncbi:Restriction endonuclease [Trichlorobacter thiogenes]|uniref:Restriction endonuclease n=1 Tax=Trichlorobacter thiogenes TaxID=115783 RepID=A0A1T4NIX5_9BACT|nr:restriction endonuclease [Trichlorobacter thiogenes]SJZ78708.1 Restriction endonuclease [Trichlorobacter thiogenes]
MNNATKNDIKNLIRRLDASASPSGSPQEAERLMEQILTPLMHEDGYTLQSVAEQRDLGLDFIARKLVGDESSSDEIGIEYKHFRQSAVGVDVVHRVLGAAASAGLKRAMLVTNSRFTYAARETLRRNTAIGIELIDLDALRSWVGRLEEIPAIDLPQIDIIRRELSRKLIELIAQSPRYLDGIEWRELEHLLTEVLKA